MEMISQADRAILRERAEIQRAYAMNERNAKLLTLWRKQAAGESAEPTVRLLFSNFTDEVITPRMRCTGEKARQIEYKLLWTLVGRELFDDDTPIQPTYDVGLHMHADPFGLKAQRTLSKKGFHIEPVIEDLTEGLAKLRGGSFGVDVAGTDEDCALASDIFGDILPVKKVMGCLSGFITNPLVQLMGMENMYISMMTEPDEFHELMDMATKVYEGLYDLLEKDGLLLPTNDFAYVGQETFAFTDELPKDRALTTRDCWGFLESQETVAISPEMYGEFIFPYQDRLVRRFGLLSYGCCESVDTRLEFLSRWKNLRKLSVSPFNNEEKVGEFLRGKRIVYYSKPRAEYVTNRGPLDEEALRKYFKGVCHAASGCLLEMAQREVGTIYGDFSRGKRYVEIAKECIAEYWKP